MVLSYPLGYYYDGPGTIGGVYPAPMKINPYFDGTYRCYNFARRPPGPNLEIRDYTLTIKQDVEFISPPGVILMPGANWQSTGRAARPRRLFHDQGQPSRRITDPRERTADLQSHRQAGAICGRLSHVHGRLSAGQSAASGHRPQSPRASLHSHASGYRPDGRKACQGHRRPPAAGRVEPAVRSRGRILMAAGIQAVLELRPVGGRRAREDGPCRFAGL